MNSIVYVGMDVHASNYTLSCYTLTNDECFATVQMEPEVKNILTYLKKVQRNLGGPCEFLCGYEAGALGFSLYPPAPKARHSLHHSRTLHHAHLPS